MSPSRTVSLVSHPASAQPPAVAIGVEVRWAPSGELCLACRLAGALEVLRIPEPCRPGPADGLWEHTCFELFVAAGSGPAYREFNFSPSGQWAAYAFTGYRERGPASALSALPRISVRRSAGSLELDAVLPPALLPPDPAGAGYRLGLSAVVEASDGSKSYWALAHPGPRPDFHLWAAFAFHLAAPPPHGI